MNDYIASILGFQGQPSSTNIEPGNASSPSVGPIHISCEGYGPRIPRKDLRLQMSGNDSDVIRIFGFPLQEDYHKSMWYPPPAFGLDGPYIHYLLGESPASVKYIMGDEWRSNLQSDPRIPLTDPRQSQVVLRPSVAGNDTCNPHGAPEDNPAIVAEERAHSLRMRRCGAAAISVVDDVSHFDIAQMDLAREYLFDWPASGGLWVLRPNSTESESEVPADHCKTDEEIMEENLERLRRYEANIAVAQKVNRQEDMEDVCRVLEGAGAQFYEVIEDCLEDVKLKLC